MKQIKRDYNSAAGCNNEVKREPIPQIDADGETKLAFILGGGLLLAIAIVNMIL